MQQAVAVYFGEFNGKLWREFSLLEDPVGGMEFLGNVNSDCAKLYGLSQPGIAMFVTYDDKPFLYSGKPDA